MLDIPTIIERVLRRLSEMNTESCGGNSSEQLIFPRKKQAKDDNIKRISEQELRLLFIEEFKKEYPSLYYSIETPTEEKYDDLQNRSALLDMCIFERENSHVFKRILNIEFKHKNCETDYITKDIKKLIHEKQEGVFIHLLDNTNSGTLCSVFGKLQKSFTSHVSDWNGESKSVQVVIISLNQRVFIHRKIYETDSNFERVFSIKRGCGNMEDFTGIGWTRTSIAAGRRFDSVEGADILSGSI